MIATVDQNTVKKMADTAKKLDNLTKDVDKAVKSVKTQVDSKKGSLGAHVKDLQNLINNMEATTKKSNQLLGLMTKKLGTAAAIRQAHIDSNVMGSGN